jgi:hypothetical protein
VFASAPGQRRVTGWEEDQVIQVSARQADRTFIFNQGDPCMAAKLLAALAAGCVRCCDKDF